MKNIYSLLMIAAMTGSTSYATLITPAKENTIKISMNVVSKAVVTIGSSPLKKSGKLYVKSDISLGEHIPSQLHKLKSFTLPVYIKSNISDVVLSMDIHAKDGKGDLIHSNGKDRIAMHYTIGNKPVNLASIDPIMISNQNTLHAMIDKKYLLKTPIAGHYSQTLEVNIAAY